MLGHQPATRNFPPGIAPNWMETAPSGLTFVAVGVATSVHSRLPFRNSERSR